MFRHPIILNSKKVQKDIVFQTRPVNKWFQELATGLFPVVYFDQRLGAAHSKRWSK